MEPYKILQKKIKLDDMNYKNFEKIANIAFRQNKNFIIGIENGKCVVEFYRNNLAVKKLY